MLLSFFFSFFYAKNIKKRENEEEERELEERERERLLGREMDKRVGLGSAEVETKE